jgi:signal transduction histidine kinase
VEPRGGCATAAFYRTLSLEPASCPVESGALKRQSIGFPVTLGGILILLVLTLGAGWQLLVVSDIGSDARGLTTIDWVLLVLGAAVSLLILIGLAWLCVWLVREMRLNQRQRAFLDAVTHEMKTPLAALRLHLETMARHDLDPEQRRQFLTRMDLDLDRLHHTVEQVLAAARAEEPRNRPTAGSVALADLLRDCTAEIRARHELPAEAVVLDATGRADVQGDEAELALVFRNLLENAVKYSDPPVEVKVHV